MRRTLIDEVMNETILFGGIPLRRQDVLRILREDGYAHRALDYFAFKPEPVSMAPWTVEQFRELL